MSYIQVQNVAKLYGHGEAAVTAVADMSFGIDSGEFRQVDAQEIAIAAGAIYEGTVLLWVYDSSLIDLERHIGSSMKLLLEGVQART